jgi:S1-C subfamily serine protease
MSHSKRLAIWTSLAAALLLAGPSAAAAQSNPLAKIEQKQQELFERVAPSVVFISRTDTFGSGFFISKDGTILTNAHVVGDAKRVDIVMHDGTRATGEVVERADDLDLALVDIDLDGDLPAVDLTGMDDLKVGSWVASVGHGSGGIWSYTTGSVSNIYPDGEQRPVFQTQIPINKGASGGPVIDRKGRVVGIVTSGIEGANDINFAIPVKTGMKRFEALADNCECLTIHAPKDAPIFVDGTMVGTGPRVVVDAEARSYEVFAVIDGEKREREIDWPGTRTVDLSGEDESTEGGE